MEISGEIKGTLDVKRFYPSGIKIILKCPNCNHEYEDTNYMGYPEMNKVIDYDCYCPECDYEWIEAVILHVSLERCDSNVSTSTA